MSMIYSPRLSKRWKPRAYQKKAVKFLTQQKNALLLQEPGLGKTAQTLASIKILHDIGEIDRALIVAPFRVMGSVWPREIAKWSDFSGLTYRVLHGRDKDRLREEEAVIHLINPEGLDWLLSVQEHTTKKGKVFYTPDMKAFRNLEYDLLVIDELSKFKHHTSTRSRNLHKVIQTFPWRWGLGGSPCPNGLIDLFGQVLIIDGGKTFGPYISHYQKAYFKPGPTQRSWEISGDWAEKTIYKKLSKIALVMRAEDYLKDMPKLVVNDIKIDLPDKARKVYDVFEDELIAFIDGDKLTAANAGVKSMKCRQIANGAVYVDEEVKALVKLPSKVREWADLHDAKLDALESLIYELQGEPLLIAYNFGHDLLKLVPFLKRVYKIDDVPNIGSGVTLKKQNEIETEWNAGRLPCCLIHPASGGHGLNLQEACHHIVWYALTWDFDQYDQTVRRIFRSGNPFGMCFCHRIIARNTVDVNMAYALARKKSGQDALFEALKDIRKIRGGDE